MRFFSSQTLANTNYYAQQPPQPPQIQQTQQSTLQLQRPLQQPQQQPQQLPPHQLRTFSPFQIKIPMPPPVQPHQQGTPVNYPNDPPKKVKWGEPTWFLLHTLSVKIKESEFMRIKHDLLNRIYAICVNLPCPDCANHSKFYLDNINFNAIQSKEDLKHMLHAFHNEVNKRKGYPYFPYEEVDEKYSKAITVNIIRNFMAHFSDRNRSIKLLATDLYRANLCNELKGWFNQNIMAFE